MGFPCPRQNSPAALGAQPAHRLHLSQLGAFACSSGHTGTSWWLSPVPLLGEPRAEPHCCLQRLLSPSPINPALAACTRFAQAAGTTGRAQPWHRLCSRQPGGPSPGTHQPLPLLLPRGAGGLEQPTLGQLWGPAQVLAPSPEPCATGPGVTLRRPGTLPPWLVSMPGNGSHSERVETAQVLPRVTLAQLAFLGGSGRCRDSLGGLPAPVLAWSQW